MKEREMQTADMNLLLDELAKTNGVISSQESNREEMIRAARKAGASWARIGQALGGITKQSAWERWKYLDNKEAS